jgi:hypothetical protein
MRQEGGGHGNHDAHVINAAAHFSISGCASDPTSEN